MSFARTFFTSARHGGTAGLLLLAATALAAPTGRDAGQLYASLCAGCHGEQMEGGKGPALRLSTHRLSDQELDRKITEGTPLGGMPAFAHAVSPAELRGLVAYIREVATRHVDPQPGPDGPVPAEVLHSERAAFRIEVVAEGLDVPWSLAFLPDGRILVTERVGRLRVIDQGRLQTEPVVGVPEAAVRDEAGLMSVVPSPDFARSGWIYLSYSDRASGDLTMTKIVRGRLHGNALTDLQPIFAAPAEHYLPGYVLYGGRLVFSGRYLFFSVGARGMETDTSAMAQDLGRPNGKIHRVFWDGSIPPDNPFVHRAGALPSIWALGVRNPQGLALQPHTGALWESEHGPRGGDELNLIQRGRNYGWPVITYGINYDGTPVSDKVALAGMEQPVLHWTPSIAPSELEFYRGDRFPGWKNQLFLGTLATQKLLRFELDGGRVTHVEQVLHGLGRIRDIKTGPDGNLYLAIESIGRLGRIVRLVPAGPNP